MRTMQINQHVKINILKMMAVRKVPPTDNLMQILAQINYLANYEPSTRAGTMVKNGEVSTIQNQNTDLMSTQIKIKNLLKQVLYLQII